MTSTTRQKRKQDQTPPPSFWAHHQFNIIKGVFVLFSCSLLGFISYQLYVSYNDYIDPKKVYGEWIE
ncbi:DUF2850 domain-containing protein, partial [Vibrio astriarenae]